MGLVPFGENITADGRDPAILTERIYFGVGVSGVGQGS